jgi:hypothetical protein
MIISFRESMTDKAIEEANDLWGTTRDQLTSKVKKDWQSIPRITLAVAMRRVLGLRFRSIGKALERSYTAIIHNDSKHDNRMSTMHGGTDKPVDPIYYDNYNAIAERLKKLK